MTTYLHATQGEKSLILLESMIPKDERLYVWCYHRDGECIASSCPADTREFLEEAFKVFGGLERAVSHIASETCSPILIGSPIGMQWAVTLEPERGRSMFYVIGPVFYTAPTERQLRETMRPYTYRLDTAKWASRLYSLLASMPVLSYSIFTRYVIMIHNALNEEQLPLSALIDLQSEYGQNSPVQEQERDRYKVYLAERALLQLVRNGDISYHNVLQGSVDLSPGVPVKGEDALRKSKTSVVVFVSLVCRAAMDGGLSPEIAYPLGDSYIQSVEDCNDSGELAALALTMYRDFIYRVHNLRINPDYSYSIQKCCDFIELNLERKVSITDLASYVGYSEYYLTQKFKKETGQSINSYVRYVKIERAKLLLETTELSVQTISEKLAFNTVNYFIECFVDVVGYTPAQYRKKSRK